MQKKSTGKVYPPAGSRQKKICSSSNIVKIWSFYRGKSNAENIEQVGSASLPTSIGPPHDDTEVTVRVNQTSSRLLK